MSPALHFLHTSEVDRGGGGKHGACEFVGSIMVAPRQESGERSTGCAGPAARRPRTPWAVAQPFLWPVLLVLFAVAYLGYYLDRGWIPSDEGLLAHTAERVLQGELPHRDFDEMYTGGLTFAHSLAFRLLGTKLIAIRLMLLGFTLAFVVAIYLIASREGPRWLAALTAACCLVWSVPNYFAGMPTWYILFFSTFGALALLRFIETRQRRWLWIAGCCGGLALTIKIVALYFIAAALMLIMFRRQAGNAKGLSPQTKERSAAFVAFTALMCACMVLLVVALLRHDLGAMEAINYVIPIGGLCGLLLWNEWNEGRGPFATRFRQLSGDVCWFLAGVAAPVVCFLIPYIISGALGDLYRGVIVLPQQRFQYAELGLQPLSTLLPALIPALILVSSCLRRPRLSTPARWGVATVWIAIGAVPLLFAANWYYWGVFALRGMIPAIACVIGLILVREKHVLAPQTRQTLFLVAALACMMALVQFPFASLIYFCYCAPLFILGLHFVAVNPANRWPGAVVGLVVFFLIFGGWRMNAAYLTESRNAIRDHRHPLTLQRAGIRVLDQEKARYEKVIQTVVENSQPGSFIYASPDCPEIYFLAERKNPTPTIYDFFDDPRGRVQRILDMLEQRNVRVVVINEDPFFSDQISDEMRQALRERFPQQVRYGTLIVALRTDSQPRVAAHVPADAPSHTTH